MKKIDTVGKEIIKLISGNLPLALSPYKVIAQKTGLTEDIVIDRINQYKKLGLIKKIKATLNHNRAGYKANVMVVWKVPENRINKTGIIITAYPEVSHCYQRPVFSEWPYNLYTMIHGRSKKHCREVIQAISARTKIKEYQLLFTIKEYKKKPPVYF